MRPFNRRDFDAFAGAVPWTVTWAPIVGEAELALGDAWCAEDATAVLVVCDATGVEVLFNDAEGTGWRREWGNEALDVHGARVFGEFLLSLAPKGDLTPTMLRVLGFTPHVGG